MLQTNLKLLAQTDLNGTPSGGEGMALKVMPDGKRYLFIAAFKAPTAFTVLDVTEPTNPIVAFKQPTMPGQDRANSLSLHEDLLLVASEVTELGGQPAGMHVYDVSDPLRPRLISFFDTSGPHSPGTHFVSTPDGQYAYLSTGAADWRPAHTTTKTTSDDQFFMIVDIRDPSRPREAGRWWVPGQRMGDDVQLTRHTAPSIDSGFRLHHALCYAERPDRAYLGYVDAGIVILDIADRSAPRLISRFDYHPPTRGYTHTVVPLFERDLLIVADEASGEHGDDGYDWPKRVWIVDSSVETNLMIMSSVPDPDGLAELHRVGGRIGAHNIHENEGSVGTARLERTVVATWFTAGVRIYDIDDPYRPEEIAAFIPETPTGQRASRINDVFVEDRGIIHALDRVNGGLYVLEYTGSRPLA